MNKVNKVFLLHNSDGQTVKAFSSLSLALLFAEQNNFRFEYRELSGITEFDIDGESWGTMHSFEELEDL